MACGELPRGRSRAGPGTRTAALGRGPPRGRTACRFPTRAGLKEQVWGQNQCSALNLYICPKEERRRSALKQALTPFLPGFGRVHPARRLPVGSVSVLQSTESAGQSGAAPPKPAAATAYHAPEPTLRLRGGTRGGGGLRHYGRDARRDNLGSDYREGVAAGPAGKMPVAVMAEGAFSFKKLLDQCENQELEVTVRMELGETSGSPPARAAPVSKVTGPGASGRGWGRAPAGRGGWAPGFGLRGLGSRLRIWQEAPQLAGRFLLSVFSE